MGRMCTKSFDDVMDLLCGAPEGTALDVRLIDSQEVFCGVETLKVALADGAGTWTVECLKGQVLRDVLLQVNLDVYDMKDKMMNCGGGGVCGTCVMRMVVADDDGWEPRPGMEEKRLKRYAPNARLSCNLVVEGDVTIELKPRKVE